ncbi:MAG: TonB-dependent receptor [Bacteroidia bacterium]|nr:TonB-dependent receptor [Bacteroidia bacterium]
MKIVHIIICAFIISSSLLGQGVKQLIKVPEGETTLSNLLASIEDQTESFFVFNASSLDLESKINLDGLSAEMPLEDLLEIVCNRMILDYEFENDLSEKIILSKAANFTIGGTIIDSFSGESIIGATIYTEKGASTISNINGHFILTFPIDHEGIIIQNLGFKRKKIVPSQKVTLGQTITLTTALDFNIVITPNAQEKIKQDRKVTTNDVSRFKSIGGLPDVFAYLKSVPGVSNGSEGQNGLIIRGGGPHQNLILMDGIPIYEGSHLGGLSSIFIPSAIKNISLYKSGFPARYGGKISGVLDVNLKEGNRKEFERAISISLEGISAHLEGPLGPNTSVNINGRFSLFSNIVEPIVKEFTDIKDLSLKYNDSYAKITHWFSQSNKLSLSAYLGEDLVLIQRNTLGVNRFKDYNRINWGNKVVSANWDLLINERISMHTTLGISDYSFRSRGTYELLYLLQDSTGIRQFDILSNSQIDDIILKSYVETYHDLIGKTTFGFDLINHTNQPSILESENFTPNNEVPELLDTIYKTNELSLFIENKYNLTKNITLNTGFRFNAFFNKDSRYTYLNPRLNLSYKNNGNLIELSYARISQFTHLLTNPALGIPSDLWVPSTNLVPPELSNNFSIDYKYFKNRWQLGASVFYKQFDNLIEYRNPSDILYSFIIDDELFQVEVDNSNWEERVTLGKGRAYGVEFFARFNSTKFDGSLAYTISKSQRIFENIDKGEAFPYKFDRPHDIATNFKYKFDSYKSLSVNWVYGTGNAYSLSDKVQEGVGEEPVLVPTSRNNSRLESFHHLDLFYSVKRILENETEFTIDVGVYNIYDRRNPFYEYLEDAVPGSAPELVKISIYPILPQVNLSWAW